MNADGGPAAVVPAVVNLKTQLLATQPRVAGAARDEALGVETALTGGAATDT